MTVAIRLNPALDMEPAVTQALTPRRIPDKVIPVVSGDHREEGMAHRVDRHQDTDRPVLALLLADTVCIVSS